MSTSIRRNAAALFTPFRLRNLTLPNRVVMSPMTRRFSPGRVPSNDVADYYARRAQAGVALIVTEGVATDHQAAVDYPETPQLHGEAALAGWRNVVTKVHAAGGLIVPQLWHQGPVRDPLVSDNPAIAGVRPSGIWGRANGTVSLDPDYVARMLAETRPASDSEIGDIILSYARSARAAVAAGFDGVAIHGAHGYLIDSFLWHETNRRDDRWGGDMARRAAFGAAVVRAVREEIGPDRPILFRFSQFKMQDYLARLADMPDELAALLGPLADAGVDLFDASQRHFEQPAFPGSPLNLAGWAKRLTGVAAMTVGGIGMHAPRDPLGVERPMEAGDNLDRVAKRLEADEFDLVAVGRALLNDSEWIARLRDGRPFLPFDRTNLQRLA
ncbi:NADH:flavin oxidoreductase [uncultured Sphingomonas sp.]|uniref:NADH:flavin oxidoreductase n=1 Tax=uncultured Sphingomonas sp. TaxID=158754 RepID=UPI0026180067|nr:NADH:flavin oxidoreductase [uncultured Sphingomonas sp.]